MGVSSSVRRPLFTIVPCLLAILLFSLSISTVHASFVTLSHDDGSRDAWYSTTKGNHLYVGFSIPHSENYRVIMVDFFVNEPGVSFKFHVYSGVGYPSTHLYEDGAMLQPELDPGQWVQVHVTKDIIVGPGTLTNAILLWVSVEYGTDNKPGIGLDTSWYNAYGNVDRWIQDGMSNSFEGMPGPITNIARVHGDLMIRVQAESLDVLAKKEGTNTAVTQTGSVQASGTGLGFAVIAIGAGAAAAAGGLAVAISQPRSEVYAFVGHYYCRKHRTPVWSVEGRLWCPVERRFLKS